MKEIQLSQGLVAQVDDDDYELLSKYRWCAHRNRNTYYAERAYWVDGRCYHMRMHRLLMNAPKGLEVDHIDHNGLNNQRSNLRVCTRKENARNMRPRQPKSNFTY